LFGIVRGPPAITDVAIERGDRAVLLDTEGDPADRRSADCPRRQGLRERSAAGGAAWSRGAAGAAALGGLLGLGQRRPAVRRREERGARLSADPHDEVARIEVGGVVAADVLAGFRRALARVSDGRAQLVLPGDVAFDRLDL